MDYRWYLVYLISGTASDTVNDQLNNPIYRVTGSGENVGLNVRIDIERDEYVAYSKSFYGAKILIHDPEDFPQASVTTSVAQPSFDVTIAVLPSVIVSEPGIRGLSQHQRNCLFDDEQRLRTTNKYSFQSCMNECTVDTILSKCDCVPFYYPESDIRVYAKRYRQCSLHDVKCLRDNRRGCTNKKYDWESVYRLTRFVFRWVGRYILQFATTHHGGLSERDEFGHAMLVSAELLGTCKSYPFILRVYS